MVGRHVDGVSKGTRRDERLEQKTPDLVSSRLRIRETEAMKKYYEPVFAVFIVWGTVMFLYWLHTKYVWLAGLGVALLWVFVINPKGEDDNGGS
jgi:hypothetical protein